MAPIAGAEDFFEQVMNQQIINTVSELPYSTFNPEVIWQEKGHIKAWVDIVGFGNLSKDDGKYYILGDPCDLAIVQNGVKAKVPGSVTKIDKSITTSQNDDFTVAVLKVDLYWKSIICDENSCWEVPHHEIAQFQDSEVTPIIFTMPGNQSVLLKRYPGNVYSSNRQNLVFDVSPTITQIHVTTDTGASMAHYLKAGLVEYTNKRVPYINLSKVNKWEVTGKKGNISSMFDEVSTEDNITSITFMTAYGNVGANVTEKVMPSTHIEPGIFGIIFVVLVVFGGIYYWKRLLK